MLRIAVLVLLILGMFSLPVSAADSETQQKAQDAFDSLYGADVKRVRATKDTADDAALAAKILEAACAVEAQPEFLAILCTNACELAAADPKGAETAQAACDLAMEKAPAAAGVCQDAIVAMRRRQYDAARGDAKSQAGDTLIEALAAAADIRLRGGDTEGAHARILKAAALARQTRSQKTDAVEGQLKAITARQRSAAEAERLKKQVEADPANAKARDPLVRLLVVDLDSPAEAAKYLDGSSDATLKKFAPAAAKAMADAPEVACLELMDWYMQLAATAGPAGKAAMYARAVQYGERFLELHAAKDLDRTRAELAVKKAQDETANLGGEASGKGRWMDVLKGIDLANNRVGGGQWQKTAEGLLLTGSDRSRMILPVIPEGSYEFEFQFVRKQGIEIDAFLPVGKGATTLVINGFGGPISALSLVRGRDLSDDAIFRNTQIVNGRPSVVRVRVVLDKDNAQVTVEMDGKEIIAWKGPQSALSPYPLWMLPDLRCIGIGGLSSDVLFQGARLRMLSGKAVPLRPADAKSRPGQR